MAARVTMEPSEIQAYLREGVIKSAAARRRLREKADAGTAGGPRIQAENPGREGGKMLHRIEKADAGTAGGRESRPRRRRRKAGED